MAAAASASIGGASARAAARVVVWFRSDLRLRDNSALSAASRALRGGVKSEAGAQRGVLGLFVLAPDQWENHKLGVAKVDFLLRNLHSLKQELEGTYRIPLLVRMAPRSEGRGHIRSVAGAVATFCREAGADHLFFNREYEVDETQRDALVAEQLGASGVTVTALHDQCAVPPGTLLARASGQPFKVFTPFKNAWLTELRANAELLQLREPPLANDAAFAAEALRTLDTTPLPKRVDELPGWRLAERPDLQPAPLRPDLFPAGEAHALERLDRFAKHKALSYKERRDFPAVDGTSVLSPYLAAGVVSPRQCLAAVAAVNGKRLDSGNAGVVHWVSEVAWRDFYRHILAAFPRVCKGRAFQEYTDQLQWRYDEADFTRWKEGRTGFPIVDAAMRQLNTTGWMHNRLRMVVAMFLTKDLFIDWRWGEEYFSRHLIDADLASNNGGWQWAASTGTDAAPYFRIFAPLSQSERFDAEGEFIRKFVPELRDVASDHIHEPARHLSPARLAAVGYYAPMVDHSEARKRVLAAFTRVRKDAEARRASGSGAVEEDEEGGSEGKPPTVAKSARKPPTPRPQPVSVKRERDESTEGDASGAARRRRLA
jgi:deoxyribodipyrimidine photo-lyase